MFFKYNKFHKTCRNIQELDPDPFIYMTDLRSGTKSTFHIWNKNEKKLNKNRIKME